MGSKRILNVATPTASTDATNKAYVDNRTPDESLINTYAELHAPMGAGAIEDRVQYGVMSFRLRNYNLPKLSGIIVNSATFLFAVFDLNLLVVTRQDVPVTIFESESLDYFHLERATYSSFPGRLDVDVVRVTLYVNVSSVIVSNKNVVCFSEILTDFPLSYGNWLVNMTKRLGT
jgi:hypothetical protein